MDTMTTDDIAKVLLDLQQRMTRIETLLETMASRGTDHESRIRSLERARYIVVGVALAAGGVSGKLAQAVGF